LRASTARVIEKWKGGKGQRNERRCKASRKGKEKENLEAKQERMRRRRKSRARKGWDGRILSETVKLMNRWRPNCGKNLYDHGTPSTEIWNQLMTGSGYKSIFNWLCH